MSEKLKTREAAQRLGVSGESVRQMCAQGQLDAHRTGGGHLRIDGGSVERFIESTRPRVRR